MQQYYYLNKIRIFSFDGYKAYFYWLHVLVKCWNYFRDAEVEKIDLTSSPDLLNDQDDDVFNELSTPVLPALDNKNKSEVGAIKINHSNSIWNTRIEF